MINLTLLKAHLRLEASETIEDVYLQHLIDTAIETFNSTQNRTLIAFDATLPDPVGNTLKITMPILHGALMLIGHWYNNRESVVLGLSAAELPLGTQRLWSQYRYFSI